MIECNRCGYKISSAGLTFIQPLKCPGCGHWLTPNQSAQGAFRLVQNYFSDIWQMITQPTAFFRQMPTQGGLSRPLGFALVTHWLGSALGFLWHLAMGGTLSALLKQFFYLTEGGSTIDHPSRSSLWIETQDRMIAWFFGAGPIIIDPFLTLSSIFLTSFFVFIGARILIAPGREGHPKQISFESAVRIISFGMTPSILAGIPLLGPVIAPLGVIILTVIGVKEVYRIHWNRAIVVALFPKLIFIGILMTGLLVILLGIVKLFTSVF